jgi:hypothetical protein
VAEIKTFSRLDRWAEPRTEVGVVHSCLHTFGPHLDEDLEQCVVEVLFLLSANELG